MKKVYQRTSNDCHTAAYASLLELPYESVPRFYDDSGRVIPNWKKLRDDFLADYGLQSIVFDNAEEIIKHIKGFYIVGIESQTEKYKTDGTLHAVIYKDGVPFFDPKYDTVDWEAKPVSIEILSPIFK